VGLLSAAAMPLVAPAVAARTVMVTWAVTTGEECSSGY
jgi:hypothetical protein